MTTTQVEAVAVAAACGWVIPLLVDLITKAHAPAGLKSALALLLSAAAGVLSTLNLAAVSWPQVLLAVAAAWTSAMTSHYAGLSQPVQQATAGFGVGPRVDTPPPAFGISPTPADPADLPPAAGEQPLRGAP